MFEDVKDSHSGDFISMEAFEFTLRMKHSFQSMEDKSKIGTIPESGIYSGYRQSNVLTVLFG